MTRKTMRSLGALATALLALAACGGPVTSPAYVDGAYQPNILNYVASRGGMPVTLVGAPFAGDPERVAEVVTATMETSHFGQRFPFFVEKPENFSSPYHMVVIFDAALGVGPASICGNPDQPHAVDEGRLKVMMALCNGDRRLTSTYGSIAQPDGPESAGFRRLIAQATTETLPPFDTRDPNRNDRFRGFIPGF